jgi:hypothetical protein
MTRAPASSPLSQTTVSIAIYAVSQNRSIRDWVPQHPLRDAYLRHEPVWVLCSGLLDLRKPLDSLRKPFSAASNLSCFATSGAW